MKKTDDILMNHAMHIAQGERSRTEVFRNAGLAMVKHDPGVRSRGATSDQAVREWLKADDLKQVPLDETRPLIDLLQEATFSDQRPMQWVKDKYALRELLRKAHCFRLDADTSAMVAEFSVAISTELEAVRQMSLPPFPVTWFEVDNIARLARLKSMGIRLTATAARDDVVKRVGWLISPAKGLYEDGYYATYCCVVAQGVLIAPMSLFWRTGLAFSDPDNFVDPTDAAMVKAEKVLFGLHPSGVGKLDAFPCAAPFHVGYQQEQKYSSIEVGMMEELSGELRHIWGLLLALGAAQHGAETTMTPQPLPTGPTPMAKGKPLLPLEHKVLTIKLSKRATIQTVTAKAVTGIKKRWHEVRGHFRTKYNEDGSIKWRIPIKAHARGDERLGKITKTYEVEK